MTWSVISTYCNEELTHWDWDKMAAILQMIFSNAFSWMKMYAFRLTSHWNLFLRVINNIGIDQATSGYLNQWGLVYWGIYVSLSLNELMSYCFIASTSN